MVAGASGTKPSQTGSCSRGAGSLRDRVRLTVPAVGLSFEAMLASCRLLVTGCLSDRDPGPRGTPTRRRSERETKGLGLLGRERRIGPTGNDCLGVEARSGSRMQAADDEPVAIPVGEGKGETLVAAGLLERIEPNEADPLDRPARLRLENRRPRRQLVELSGDGQYLVEVGVEDRLEAAALCAAGDSIEAAPQTRLAPRQHRRDHEEEQNEDDEADDDRAQIRGDESVQIDRTVLRQASEAGTRPSSESSRCHPPRTTMAADAILRGFHRSSLGGISNHMAKRSRIGGRPGQRRPMQRTAGRPAGARPARPAGSVTREEELRAAELEAAILAEEKVAEDARRSRERSIKRPVEGAVYSSTNLATRAAEEYGYVRRDVRRIVVVGGSLLGVLAILHILVNVAHVI